MKSTSKPIRLPHSFLAPGRPGRPGLLERRISDDPEGHAERFGPQWLDWQDGLVLFLHVALGNDQEFALENNHFSEFSLYIW